MDVRLSMLQLLNVLSTCSYECISTAIFNLIPILFCSIFDKTVVVLRLGCSCPLILSLPNWSFVLCFNWINDLWTNSRPRYHVITWYEIKPWEDSDIKWYGNHYKGSKLLIEYFKTRTLVWDLNQSTSKIDHV